MIQREEAELAQAVLPEVGEGVPRLCTMYLATVA
jgi:hypothetical protein